MRSMRSMRDERGQAAVSYGGILAMLAVVFLALSALGIDGRIARAVEGAVCVITGGSDCEQPDGTKAAQRGGESVGLRRGGLFDSSQHGAGRGLACGARDDRPRLG